MYLNWDWKKEKRREEIFILIIRKLWKMIRARCEQ